MTCPHTVRGVACILTEGHVGDCLAPTVVQHNIINAAEWNRLQSYRENEDTFGFVQMTKDLARYNVPFWQVAVRGLAPTPHFEKVRPQVEDHDMVQVKVARDHSKSETWVVGDCSHHLGFSTDDESDWYGWDCVLFRESSAAAQKSMGAIMEVFEKNPLVKAMFRNEKGQDVVDMAKTWTRDQIWLNIPGLITRSPTLQGLGMHGSSAGDHPREARFDDVFTLKNQETKHQRSRGKQWWEQNVEGILGPGTRQLHTFTPYFDDDVNAELESEGTYYTVSMPALNRMPTMDDIQEDGFVYEMKSVEKAGGVVEEQQVLVNVELTEDAKEDLHPLWGCPLGAGNCPHHKSGLWRRHIAEYGMHRPVEWLVLKWVKNQFAFTRQYMLLLDPGDSALVKPEMIHLYAYPNEMDDRGRQVVGLPNPYNRGQPIVEHPGWDKVVAAVHGWDFALGQTKKHDETAMAAAYRDSQGRVFYDVDSGRWHNTEIVPLMRNRWRTDPWTTKTGREVNWIVAEAINFQRIFGDHLEASAPELINVDKITRSPNKAQAFVECGIQEGMHTGRVLFHWKDRKTIEQLLRFTGDDGTRDDRVDAVRLAHSKIKEAMGRMVRVHRRAGGTSKRGRGGTSRRSMGRARRGGRRGGR